MIGVAWTWAASVAQANGAWVVGRPLQYATIQAAVDAAAPGDTVYVEPGTYPERLILPRDVEIVGAGAGSTVITGSAVGAWIVEVRSTAGRVALRELTLHPAARDRGLMFGGGSTTDLVLDGVELTGTDMRAMGGYVIGATNVSTRDLVLARCDVHDDHQAAGYGTLSFTALGEVVVDRSTFADVSGTALRIASAAQDNAASVVIRDSVFQRNGNGADLVADRIEVTGTRFEDHAGYGLTGYAVASGTSTLSGCTFEGNGDGATLNSLFGTVARWDTRGNTFRYQAGDGLRVVSDAELHSAGDAFCANGGGQLDAAGSRQDVANLLVWEAAEGVSLAGSSGGTLRYATLAGGTGSAGLELVHGPTASDLVIAGQASVAVSASSGQARVSRVLVAPATPNAGNVLVSARVLGDPRFVAAVPDGDCDDDDLRLGAGSAAIDRGNPALQDPDGSRSDLGAFGGPAALGWRDRDGDGVAGWSDCDDADPAVFPGQDERCNGRDDDCDGEVDDDDLGRDPSLQPLRWPDQDLDGRGDAHAPATPLCQAGLGWTTTAGDCDDSEASVHAGAADPVGDGIDQDCDGLDG